MDEPTRRVYGDARVFCQGVYMDHRWSQFHFFFGFLHYIHFLCHFLLYTTDMNLVVRTCELPIFTCSLFFLIAFLQIKPECSAPAVHKVCPTREPIAPSNGRKKLELPVQKNILTNYFCILSTYCNFSHEYVT